MHYKIGDEPIPGYRLAVPLGTGGFGTVWKAVGPGGIEIALKIVALDREQGLKEFKALGRIKLIRHSNLVPLMSFWLKDTNGYVLDDAAIELSLQPVSGTLTLGVGQFSRPSELLIAMGLGDMTLADRLAQCCHEGFSGIPLPELLGYMDCAARAIDFLNFPRQDVPSPRPPLQHCDIKPQNILIVGDSAQVCDFGVVRVLGDVRMTSQALSPVYSAPEMMSQSAPSASTDQYSLAISYFELRTGKLPFKDHHTAFAIMDAHLKGDLDFSLLPTVEREAVQRATALNPNDRFATATHLVEALRRAGISERTDSHHFSSHGNHRVHGTDTRHPSTSNHSDAGASLAYESSELIEPMTQRQQPTTVMSCDTTTVTPSPPTSGAPQRFRRRSLMALAAAVMIVSGLAWSGILDPLIGRVSSGLRTAAVSKSPKVSDSTVVSTPAVVIAPTIVPTEEANEGKVRDSRPSDTSAVNIPLAPKTEPTPTQLVPDSEAVTTKPMSSPNSGATPIDSPIETTAAVVTSAEPVTTPANASNTESSTSKAPTNVRTESSSASLSASSQVALTTSTLPKLEDTLLQQKRSSQDANELTVPWALLIGCEHYLRANKLRYTVNDVEQLDRTLQSSCGLLKSHILKMSDNSINERYKPLKTNLESELPSYLRQMTSRDSLIVYFSGHGFRDTDGRMYLAPLDLDPKRPAETGIAVEWFRQQLADCPAAYKLLIIDACHAGSEKGDNDATSIPSKELGDPFKDLVRVVTLASSKADQKSQIWDDKKQSLFSYWLNQGLKGHADGDNDGAINFNELYTYVSHMVSQTAEQRFSLPQTPVGIVLSNISESPVLFRLQPQRLKDVLANMAEQISDGIAGHKGAKVGVLEFTTDSSRGELLGANFGQMGKWCMQELERQMAERSGGKFSVVDQRRLQTALSAQQFSINDLSSAVALKELSTNAGGMPFMALGALRGRKEDIVSLRCKLIQTESNETLATVGGTARISESEWAMFGHSAVVDPGLADVHSSVAYADRPVSARIISQLDIAASADHPLKNPSTPFHVRILVGGKERPGVFSGNDLLVPLRRGEVFQIEVENRSGQQAAMRLLVDGLNTLPETDMLNSGTITVVSAPRVTLDNARHWILDPKKARTNVIAGFVTETGEKGKLREFKIVDGGESIAARKRFTEQIGLITAAFYEPAPQLANSVLRSGDIGVTFGDERTADLTERSDVLPGRLISVIHIQYLSPESIRTP